MVDKLIKDTVGKVLKQGEKVAPVRSVKLKVKFAKTKALNNKK